MKLRHIPEPKNIRLLGKLKKYSWENYSKKRGLTYVLLFFVLILIVGIFFRSKSHKTISKIEQKDAFIQEKELAVNDLLAKKPSAQVLEKEIELLESQANSFAKEKNIFSDEINASIKQLIKKLKKEKSFDMKQFFDTKVIASDLEFDQIHLNLNHLYLHSPNKSKIFRINLGNKSTKTYSSLEMPNLQGFYTERGVVSIYNKNGQRIPLEQKNPSAIAPSNVVDVVNLVFWNKQTFLLSSSSGLMKGTQEEDVASMSAYFLEASDQEYSKKMSGLLVNGYVYLYDERSLSRYRGGERFETGRSLSLQKDESIKKAITLTGEELLVILSSAKAIHLDANFYELAYYQDSVLENALISNFDPGAKRFFVLKDKILFEMRL